MATHLKGPGNERGIALIVAIIALVIIGLLAGASLYFSGVERRAGGGSVEASQAFNAADAGAENTLAAWSANAPVWNALAVDSSIVLTTTSLGGGNAYSPIITRISPTLFWIRSTGTSGNRGGSVTARAVVGNTVRLLVPNIDIRAAVTVNGPTTISGSSQISGVDSIPVGWGSSCAPAVPPVAGVRDSSATVTTSGACSGASCITGVPQILVDSTVNSGTFNQFGSIDFAGLAASATWTISGTVNGLGPTQSGSPASCTLSSSTNWGEPNTGFGSVSSCFNYFPILYAPGDVRITGGRGQGILLVEGDLELAGGVDFYGAVIVHGHVRSTGTGGHVFGGLLAQSADLSATLISGNSVVDYSACAVTRATRGSAAATRLGERGWAQLF
ncbi:MAG: hypothetical protein ACREMO_12225 [Gemmatimonadales bacterium]